MSLSIASVYIVCRRRGFLVKETTGQEYVCSYVTTYISTYNMCMCECTIHVCMYIVRTCTTLDHVPSIKYCLKGTTV